MKKNIGRQDLKESSRKQAGEVILGTVVPESHFGKIFEQRLKRGRQLCGQPGKNLLGGENWKHHV